MEKSLLIHADGVDSKNLDLIFKIFKHPSVVGLVAMMPDTHYGDVPVGLTCRFGESIVPGFVGSDIGCGVDAYLLGNIKFDPASFDNAVKAKIPLGMSHRTASEGEKLAAKYGVKDDLLEAIALQNHLDIRKNPVAAQLGTLGGGNHFIEIGRDEDGDLWLFTHSGSRNFGLQVAGYYERLAAQNKGQGVPKGMEYLPMDAGGDDYLRDMRIAQRFAQANRYTMLRVMLDILNVKYDDADFISSVHNFIGDDNICRKGAIAAYDNQPLVIPMNMSFGTVIGRGRGRKAYNYSAPHGAGRVHGRGEMKRMLKAGEVTMDEFREKMQGIYTSTANEGTIDESPMAYKPFDTIQKYLEQTVTIDNIVKPVYNLKG